jgi:hypothetical protein
MKMPVGSNHCRNKDAWAKIHSEIRLLPFAMNFRPPLNTPRPQKKQQHPGGGRKRTALLAGWWLRNLVPARLHKCVPAIS